MRPSSLSIKIRNGSSSSPTSTRTWPTTSASRPMAAILPSLQGELHGHEGPLADAFALDFNPPTVLLDDALADREAQARPFADLFGREEGIEDLGQVLWGKPVPGVGNGDLDHSWLASSSLAPGYGGDDDSDLSHPFNGVKGVAQKIQQELLKHLGIGLDLDWREGVHDDPRVGHGALPVHEGDRLRDDPAEIDQRKRRLPLPREVQEPPDDGGGAVHFPLDHREESGEVCELLVGQKRRRVGAPLESLD